MLLVLTTAAPPSPSVPPVASMNSSASVPLRTISRPHEATLTRPISVLREQGFGSSPVLEVKG